MKVPLSLLLSYCDPGLSAGEVADALALTGTEVERITTLGVGGVENFVVGRVDSLTPHPDADRLKVCAVDVGDGEQRTIVCGAGNVAEGQLVAVALPGAVVKGPITIKKAKLRGVESHGMICSIDELDLGSGSDGILVLGEEHGPPGRALAEVVSLSETVLELEVTPNRPDCLGVYGVARELHAATGAPLAAEPWAEDRGCAGPVEGASIEVDPQSGCGRFTARVYEGIPASAATPLEVQALLHAAGMRSISPVVDITNFAMLVTGEPMHAFDLDLVEGKKIDVRPARAGEEVATLDGQTHRLTTDDVLIADANGPTSIAGLMGGQRSEVSPSTTRVLLEAAVWDGPRLNRTSARLALRSEASARFEKGLSAELPMRAQAFASVLFSQWCGIEPAPGTVDVGGPPATPEPIELRLSQVEGLLGIGFEAAEAARILEALGCDVDVQGDRLQVFRPSDRLDLSRPVDLIEELARLDGLARLTPTLPSAAVAPARLTGMQLTERRLADALAGNGCMEIAGWSFASTQLADRLGLTEEDPRRSCVELDNPMSADEAVMRTTLIGSLLDALELNVARGRADLKLFEIGTVYEAIGGGRVNEPRKVAAVMCGPQRTPNWRDSRPPAIDFHAAKGLLGSVMAFLRVEWDTCKPDVPEPFLHPGRSAVVKVAGVPCGWLGELHPDVADEFAIPPTAAFELDLEPIKAALAATATFVPYSAMPAVVQDLAIVCDQGIEAATITRLAHEVGGHELESVTVFDVYEGGELAQGSVSLAMRLVFRADDRTMTEDEASRIRETIAARIELETGAKARV